MRRPWGERAQDRATWYQPLEDDEAIDRSVQWVLGRPGVFLNTTGDIQLLPRVLDAASRYRDPVPDSEMEAVIERYRLEPLFTE